jgi:hypothetical protein
LLGGPYTVENAYRHWVFGKLAAGDEDGAAVAFGTPAVTTMRTARVYSFSGYTSGTIAQCVPAASFAHLSHATDPQMPTVTTTQAGALAVACLYQADDNTPGNATGEEGGDWTVAVAVYEQNATTPDSCLALQTCIPTNNPGTVSGGAVATANDPCGVIGFQIKAVGATTYTPATITAPLASVGGLTKKTLKPLAGPLAPTAMVTRQMQPATLAAPLSATGTVTAAMIYGKTLAGSLAF